MKIFVLLAFSALRSVVFADQVLVLSGGGSPLGNHYSQYLQTKTLSDQLRVMLPQTDVTVYFGAGNATTQAPVLADVHRVQKEGQTSREVMVIGSIDDNQAARRENVNAYFQSSKIASMKSDETLFMIISDHGMPYQFENGTSDQTFSNNCIDLWGFESNLSKNEFSFNSPIERCLSKNQLQSALEKSVPAQRTVYAMSQCFSGGFHKMTVSEKSGYPTANPKICGFTAITEDTTASGCTPDVDGPGYQGYERSFTEQLTGVDVVSGQRLRPARTSLFEAHREATVEDLAKDIPLASSDFFLWKWSLAIEKASFQPRTKAISADNARQALKAVTIGQRNLSDVNYLSKDAFFSRMQNEFLRLYPEYQTTFLGPLDTHQKLEAQLSAKMTNLEKSIDGMSQSFSQKNAKLMTRWNQFVQSGQSALSKEEVKVELEIIGFFDSTKGSGMGGQAALAIMSLKTITDLVFAEQISQYKARRYQYAMDWALSSGDQQLVKLAHDMKEESQQIEMADSSFVELQKKHGHVRRLLIYREILGAWNALSQMQDQQALKELKDLIECESTPLKQ